MANQAQIGIGVNVDNLSELNDLNSALGAMMTMVARMHGIQGDISASGAAIGGAAGAAGAGVAKLSQNVSKLDEETTALLEAATKSPQAYAQLLRKFTTGLSDKELGKHGKFLDDLMPGKESQQALSQFRGDFAKTVNYVSRQLGIAESDVKDFFAMEKLGFDPKTITTWGRALQTESKNLKGLLRTFAGTKLYKETPVGTVITGEMIANELARQTKGRPGPSQFKGIGPVSFVKENEGPITKARISFGPTFEPSKEVMGVMRGALAEVQKRLAQGARNVDTFTAEVQDVQPAASSAATAVSELTAEVNGLKGAAKSATTAVKAAKKKATPKTEIEEWQAKAYSAQVSAFGSINASIPLPSQGAIQNIIGTLSLTGDARKKAIDDTISYTNSLAAAYRSTTSRLESIAPKIGVKALDGGQALAEAHVGQVGPLKNIIEKLDKQKLAQLNKFESLLMSKFGSGMEAASKVKESVKVQALILINEILDGIEAGASSAAAQAPAEAKAKSKKTATKVKASTEKAVDTAVTTAVDAAATAGAEAAAAAAKTSSSTATAALKKSEGWKLHLKVAEGAARDPLLKELERLKKAGEITGFKQGNADVGKAITVYVGALDDAQKIARKIHDGFNDMLETVVKGDQQLETDVKFIGKIFGRFETFDKRFSKYGFKGFQALFDDMAMATGPGQQHGRLIAHTKALGGTGRAAPAIVAQAREDAYKLLAQLFGTAFTGTSNQFRLQGTPRIYAAGSTAGAQVVSPAAAAQTAPAPPPAAAQAPAQPSASPVIAPTPAAAAPPPPPPPPPPAPPAAPPPPPEPPIIANTLKLLQKYNELSRTIVDNTGDRLKLDAAILRVQDQIFSISVQEKAVISAINPELGKSLDAISATVAKRREDAALTNNEIRKRAAADGKAAAEAEAAAAERRRLRAPQLLMPQDSQSTILAGIEAARRAAAAATAQALREQRAIAQAEAERFAAARNYNEEQLRAASARMRISKRRVTEGSLSDEEIELDREAKRRFGTIDSVNIRSKKLTQVAMQAMPDPENFFTKDGEFNTAAFNAAVQNYLIFKRRMEEQIYDVSTALLAGTEKIKRGGISTRRAAVTAETAQRAAMEASERDRSAVVERRSTLATKLASTDTATSAIQKVRQLEEAIARDKSQSNKKLYLDEIKRIQQSGRERIMALLAASGVVKEIGKLQDSITSRTSKSEKARINAQIESLKRYAELSRLPLEEAAKLRERDLNKAREILEVEKKARIERLAAAKAEPRGGITVALAEIDKAAAAARSLDTTQTKSETSRIRSLIERIRLINQLRRQQKEEIVDAKMQEQIEQERLQLAYARAQAMKSLGTRIQFFERELDAIFRAGFRVKMVGLDLRFAGERITTVVQESLKMFGDFEFMAAKAAGALGDWAMSSDEATGGFDTLQKKVIEASISLRMFSAEEIAKSLYFYASATGQVVKDVGDLNNVMTALVPIMKASAMTGTSYEQTIKGVYSIVTQFNPKLVEMSTLQGDYNILTMRMADITEKLFLVTQKTAAEFPDLVNSFKMVGPVAAQAGASFEDMVDLLGRLADLGIRGTMSGRGLRQMFIQMVRPSELAKKAYDSLFAEATANSEELAKRWGTIPKYQDIFFPDGSFTGTTKYVNELALAFMNVSKQTKNYTLARISTANELPILTALVNQQINAIEREGRALNGTAQAASKTSNLSIEAAEVFNKAWAKLENSTNGVLNSLTRTVEAVKITVGGAIAEAIKPAVEQIQGIVMQIYDWVDANQELVKDIGGLIAAAGVFLTIAGGIAILVGSLIGLVAAIKLVISSFARVVPTIGGSLIFVSALIAALAERFGEIQASLQGLAASFAQTFSGASANVESLIGVFDALGGQFKFVADIIVQVIKSVIDTFAALIRIIPEGEARMDALAGVARLLSFWFGYKLVTDFLKLIKVTKIWTGLQAASFAVSYVAHIVKTAGAIKGLKAAVDALKMTVGTGGLLGILISGALLLSAFLPIEDIINKFTYSLDKAKEKAKEAASAFGSSSTSIQSSVQKIAESSTSIIDANITDRSGLRASGSVQNLLTGETKDIPFSFDRAAAESRSLISNFKLSKEYQTFVTDNTTAILQLINNASEDLNESLARSDVNVTPVSVETYAKVFSAVLTKSGITGPGGLKVARSVSDKLMTEFAKNGGKVTYESVKSAMPGLSQQSINAVFNALGDSATQASYAESMNATEIRALDAWYTNLFRGFDEALASNRLSSSDIAKILTTPVLGPQGQEIMALAEYISRTEDEYLKSLWDQSLKRIDPTTQAQLLADSVELQSFATEAVDASINSLKQSTFFIKESLAKKNVDVITPAVEGLAASMAGGRVNASMARARVTEIFNLLVKENITELPKTLQDELISAIDLLASEGIISDSLANNIKTQFGIEGLDAGNAIVTAYREMANNFVASLDGIKDAKQKIRDAIKGNTDKEDIRKILRFTLGAGGLVTEGLRPGQSTRTKVAALEGLDTLGSLINLLKESPNQTRKSAPEILSFIKSQRLQINKLAPEQKKNLETLLRLLQGEDKNGKPLVRGRRDRRFIQRTIERLTGGKGEGTIDALGVDILKGAGWTGAGILDLIIFGENGIRDYTNITEYESIGLSIVRGLLQGITAPEKGEPMLTSWLEDSLKTRKAANNPLSGALADAISLVASAPEIIEGTHNLGVELGRQIAAGVEEGFPQFLGLVEYLTELKKSDYAKFLDEFGMGRGVGGRSVIVGGARPGAGMDSPNSMGEYDGTRVGPSSASTVKAQELLAKAEERRLAQIEEQRRLLEESALIGKASLLAWQMGGPIGNLPASGDRESGVLLKTMDEWFPNTDRFDFGLTGAGTQNASSSSITSVLSRQNIKLTKEQAQTLAYMYSTGIGDTIIPGRYANRDLFDYDIGAGYQDHNRPLTRGIQYIQGILNYRKNGGPRQVRNFARGGPVSAGKLVLQAIDKRNRLLPTVGSLVSYLIGNKTISPEQGSEIVSGFAAGLITFSEIRKLLKPFNPLPTGQPKPSGAKPGRVKRFNPFTSGVNPFLYGNMNEPGVSPLTGTETPNYVARKAVENQTRIGVLISKGLMTPGAGRAGGAPNVLTPAQPVSPEAAPDDPRWKPRPFGGQRGAGSFTSLVENARVATNRITNLFQGISTAVNWFEEAKSVGAAYGSGFNEGLVTTVNVGIKIVAEEMEGQSPPKKGPLRRIDKGGYNVGKAWGGSFSRAAVDSVRFGAKQAKQAIDASNREFAHRGNMDLTFNRNDKKKIEISLNVTGDGSANRATMSELRKGLMDALIMADLEHMVEVI